MNCPVCGAPAMISIINGAEQFHYACSIIHLIPADRLAYEEVFAS